MHLNTPPPVIVTVAIPAAPVVAVTATALPTKSKQDILPAVPTTDPSSLTVNPPIAPVPDAVIPVKQEPSPQNLVAQKTPPEFIALIVDPARHTLKELSPVIQRSVALPIAS